MRDEESGAWRSRPASTYWPSGRRLVASTQVLARTAAILQSVTKREAACLWLGEFDTRRDAVVRALVVPKQINRGRNYLVPAAASVEVANLARPRKWTVVAAVHSHPGAGVEHSEYDDEMTPSRQALSIVFPNYGDLQQHWSDSLGVHEYIDGYWHLLPPEDAQRRIVFDSGLRCEEYDLR